MRNYVNEISVRSLGRTGAMIVVGIAIVVMTASLLLQSVGASPLEAAEQFWYGSFGTPSEAARTATVAVPLLLVALGWIISLRAGRIHVGFPGQILIGGLFAAMTALKLDGLPAVVHLPLTMLAAGVGGGLYALIAAALWAFRNVQEIVSTLLMNLIAVQIIAFAVRGPLQESVGSQPQTDPLPESALWPRADFIAGGALSWSVILIPIAVLGVTVLINRTTIGFRLRLVGANPVAATYAGYSPKAVGVMAMTASGVMAGFAGGCLLLAGETPGMTEGFESHIGFNGIAVALLAFNSPARSILAALLFAALTVGSGGVEVFLGVPSTIASVLQGVIIVVVLLAATILSRRAPSSKPPAGLVQNAETAPSDEKIGASK